MKREFWLVFGTVILLAVFAGCLTVPERPADMKARDFTLPLLGGGQLTLSDYLGKPVLLTFFTPTCSRCIAEAPLIESAYRKYRDTYGLVVVGVGYIGTGSETALQQFVDNAGITHPVVIDTPETRVYSQYGVSTVPRNFFFDRCGTIVQEAGELDETALERYLQKIL